jgi:nickel-dependent lactate racemase
VLFVVPDATRSAAAGQAVNLIVRRLIANGTLPFEMSVIFATGIHRKVTDAEKSSILTPFIAQRIKTLDHDPRDLMQLIRIGETSGGIPVELNRALVEFDHVITIGSINFHYFAGFTGGRKSICPGLASAGTIAATHKLAFDPDRLERSEGVGPALLEDNPVHEAFAECAAMVKNVFGVNTIVDENGNATALFCGEPVRSHLAACEEFAKAHTIEINEKRATVVVSCGGHPHDLNMIQAHKALDAASKACTDGGTIYFIAQCGDGLGRADLIDWFSATSSKELAQRLAEKYKVNGQTAWSLLKKAEKFDVRILTELSDEVIGKLRLHRVDPGEIEKAGKSNGPGFIIPHGSNINIKLV